MHKAALFAVAAVLTGWGAVPALAAPAPCTVVTDPQGDAVFAGGSPGDPGLDITKTTFETGRGHLIVRVTVADLSAVSATDRAWHVALSVHEQQFTLDAERHLDGDIFAASARQADAGASVDRSLGRIGGQITPQRNEILLDVPLSLLSASQGSKAYAITVASFADTGASGSTVRSGSPDDPYSSVGVYEDFAKGYGDYRMRPGC